MKNLTKVNKAAINEVIDGLISIRDGHRIPPALNEGDYSGYYWLGFQVGKTVIKLSEKETLKPKKSNPKWDWARGWVYSYWDPKIEITRET